MSKEFQIETVPLGMMATNCYLAMNKATGKMIIIDPADETERLKQKIEAMGGVPEAVFLTHGHFDHIGAADEIRKQYGIPVCALDKEQEICEDESKNLSVVCGRGFTVKVDRYFTDGENIEFAGAPMKVLHTPGHTAGSACYYMEREHVLFAGDTLFCGSVGRTDLPTGSMRALRDSIHTKLFLLPEDVLVFPGHGEATSIGYEKMYNPY